MSHEGTRKPIEDTLGVLYDVASELYQLGVHSYTELTKDEMSDRLNRIANLSVDLTANLNYIHRHHVPFLEEPEHSNSESRTETTE